MKIKIKRFNKEQKIDKIEEFRVSTENTILESLIEIKEKHDDTLSFRCGCRSGICGSCAIRVNGVEHLACKTYLHNEDLIEPLKNTTIIKDLVVELNHENRVLKDSNSFLNIYKKTEISPEDEKLIDTQSNCILCQSCFSSCPVYEVNKNFLGPYALTRALRYVEDKKEKDITTTLTNVQNDGIWDCTLCGNCTFVCPQFIDPKTDIMKLRIKSAQNGFEDKSLQNFSDFNGGFDLGFDPSGGFNPNGF